MNRARSTTRTLGLVTLLVGLASCADSDAVTEPGGPDLVLEVRQPAFENSRGAVTTSGTFRQQFPPNPAVPFVPVPAPCLALGAPLQMSGVWSGWFRTVLTPNGRLHVTEQIDWSEVALALGDLTWLPGPGAYEPIVQNVPATADDAGEAAFVVRHQYNVRFISQDGLPDLRVTHSVKQVLGPDLQFRHNEFVPFTADCLRGA